MNIILFLIVNVLLWSYVIRGLVQGKQVIFEAEVGMKYLFVLFLFIFGLLAYFNYKDSLSLINLISLTIAGLLNYATPSGLCRNGLMINGRFYDYKKVIDIKVIKDKRIQIMITLKQKTLFLFKDLKDEKETRLKVKELYRG